MLVRIAEGAPKRGARPAVIPERGHLRLDGLSGRRVPWEKLSGGSVVSDPILLVLAFLLTNPLWFVALLPLLLIRGLITTARPRRIYRFVGEHVTIQLLILLVFVALLIWLAINYADPETDVRTHVVM